MCIILLSWLWLWDMFEQIVMIDTPSAVFGGSGIVQRLLWMTVREPRLRSHDGTPAVWGTAWSLTFPGTWCRCCFIFLCVPVEKSLEHLQLFRLAWPTSSKETNWQTEVAHRLQSLFNMDAGLWHKPAVRACIKSSFTYITSATEALPLEWLAALYT